MIHTTHVLLVAADPPARALVAQAIDAAGHIRLTVADSPGEARTLLNAHRYGLVIATNLGIPPWLSIDVIPVDRTYEAMFLSGHWDDELLRECEVRRLHRVRVPCDFDVLRNEIAKVVSKVRLIEGHDLTRSQDQTRSRLQSSPEKPVVANAAWTTSRSGMAKALTSSLDVVLVNGLAGIALILALLTQPGRIELIRSVIFICVSAVLALTNLRTGIIPDRITLPFLLIGLLTSPASQHPGLESALLGALIGGGTVFVIILVSRGGMGGGILKMAAMVGAFLGWRLTILALVLSFIGGGTAGWAVMLFGRRRSGNSLEFAPYLALAATISLLAGDRMLRSYLR